MLKVRSHCSSHLESQQRGACPAALALASLTRFRSGNTALCGHSWPAPHHPPPLPAMCRETHKVIIRLMASTEKRRRERQTIRTLASTHFIQPPPPAMPQKSHRHKASSNFSSSVSCPEARSSAPKSVKCVALHCFLRTPWCPILHACAA